METTDVTSPTVNDDSSTFGKDLKKYPFDQFHIELIFMCYVMVVNISHSLLYTSLLTICVYRKPFCIYSVYTDLTCCFILEYLTNHLSALILSLPDIIF